MSQDPFDLVREWFAAYNRDDLDVLESLYGPTASLEQDQALTQSRDGIRTVLAPLLRGVAAGVRRRDPAPRAHDRTHRKRHDPRRVGRARTAQRRPVPCASAAATRTSSSRSGTIHMQREVADTGPLPDEEPPPPAESAPPSRRYPPRPVVGVGAVIFDEGRVVLIKRKYEPLAGQWSLPGGTLDLGESLEAGVAREIREETGLEVHVGPSSTCSIGSCSTPMAACATTSC